MNAEYEQLGKPAVTLDDIKHFRQLGSKAPGHPEYHWVSGVETTTGPLGQGIATSVGMAIAAASGSPAATTSRASTMFDYNIYAVCGDGCMMEGVGSEAASLAGHLGLDNLCWIYDNNHITIEGNTKLAFTEDVAARFTAYGWNVLHVGDANDTRAHRERADRLSRDQRPADLDHPRQPHRLRFAAQVRIPPRRMASRWAKTRSSSPSAPMAGRRTRSSWCPTACCEHFAAGIGKRGGEGAARLAGAVRRVPQEVSRARHRDRPDAAARAAGRMGSQPAGLSRRREGHRRAAMRPGKVLNVLAQNIPWLIGGSADLGPSTKTLLNFMAPAISSPATPGGRNLHFGIREHAMAAIVNGLALSKLRAYGATFFIFSDYARPAIRLSAIMELPTIFVFTHDAMGDGEDGPTHQPVEHLASLRAIPGLMALRPGDANEVVEAYRYVMQLRHRPALLALSRQALPTLDRSKYASAVRRRARRLRAGRRARRRRPKSS